MKTLKRTLAVMASVAVSALPLLAAAQITTVTGSDITSVSALITFLQALLRFLFIIFGVLAVILILWSAFLFATSGDNQDRRKAATGYLLWGVVAIVVATLAFTIIPLVQSIINLPNVS